MSPERWLWSEDGRPLALLTFIGMGRAVKHWTLMGTDSHGDESNATYWMTSDGRVLRPDQMSARHMLQVIRALDHGGYIDSYEYRPLVQTMRRYLSSRGYA